MVSFETELKVARGLFEKRLKTLKRIRHHIQHLSESSDEYSAGEVALKIAEAELDSARQQLDNTIQAIRQGANPQSTPSTEDRDHFSEALDRVDPKSRLKLGR